MAEVVPIPEPRGLPVLGHITKINPEYPLGSFIEMAENLGEVYRLRLPGRTIVVASTWELVNELCDEKRFRKCISRPLGEIRNGVHDGLFTAREGEENWGIAHRVLMPAFGPLPIAGMFDEMHDIATQLALKWARYGPDEPIKVTDDFTRLTLDTLALCSMGFRFNSYYSHVLHPFIQAMGDFLTEAGNRPNRPPLASWFYRARDDKFRTDIEVLRDTARGVLEERKRRPSSRRDLLTVMLEGVDPKTGRKMTDESIMDNLVTFLIAGHETTSGLLSFTFYQLLSNPEMFAKAQKEVDEVVGKGVIKESHLPKLRYLAAVLREALRVNSTIPLFIVEPRQDTLLAGKYQVKEGEAISLLLAKSHRDPAVYGDDADEFRPERMVDEEFDRLPPNAWKPFGNGARACIGRPFAWQEALLVVAMLLQNFDFELEPGYELKIHQTLTVKPKNMHMRATLREGLTPTTLERRLAGLAPTQTAQPSGVTASGATTPNGKPGSPLTILYGSNSGTCEALAQRLATDAPAHGFTATKVASLDSATKDSLPKDQPVLIVTASYEGQPPDNARQFVSWLEGLEGAGLRLDGVSFAVFGCGNRDWTRTFHRIPKLVDAKLAAAGATRLADLGLADAAGGELFTEFETWEDETLWPSLERHYDTGGKEDDQAGGVSVAVSHPRSLALRQSVHDATVVRSLTLTKGGDPAQAKKHVEIRLPQGVTYRPGDYLSVLPINPSDTVRRAMRRFGLPWDAHLTITADALTSLPTRTSMPAYEVLSSYVELSQPATKRNLLTIAEAAKDETLASELTRLANEAYADEVSSKRVSVLDLLDRYTTIDLPIGIFLAMLPPMRMRQYSISSSPSPDPSLVTVTFSILNEPSLSGQGPYIGVATWYLSSLAEGDSLHVAVRPSHAAFCLPEEAEKTPLLCVAAGTGIAPFRSFIQERAAMKARGEKLAPAMLYFGCRSPETDDLYADEFAEWERQGVVTVRRTYSKAPEQSGGCRYVGERMWREKEEIVDLWRGGAKVYVCGSKRVAEGVKDVFVRMKLEWEQDKGEAVEEAAAREWFESMRNIREDRPQMESPKSVAAIPTITDLRRMLGFGDPALHRSQIFNDDTRVFRGKFTDSEGQPGYDFFDWKSAKHQKGLDELTDAYLDKEGNGSLFWPDDPTSARHNGLQYSQDRSHIRKLVKQLFFRLNLQQHRNTKYRHGLQRDKVEDHHGRGSGSKNRPICVDEHEVAQQIQGVSKNPDIRGFPEPLPPFLVDPALKANTTVETNRGQGRRRSSSSASSQSRVQSQRVTRIDAADTPVDNRNERRANEPPTKRKKTCHAPETFDEDTNPQAPRRDTARQVFRQRDGQEEATGRSSGQSVGSNQETIAKVPQLFARTRSPSCCSSSIDLTDPGSSFISTGSPSMDTEENAITRSVRRLADPTEDESTARHILNYHRGAAALPPLTADPSSVDTAATPSSRITPVSPRISRKYVLAEQASAGTEQGANTQRTLPSQAAVEVSAEPSAVPSSTVARSPNATTQKPNIVIGYRIILSRSPKYVAMAWSPKKPLKKMTLGELERELPAPLHRMAGEWSFTLDGPGVRAVTRVPNGDGGIYGDTLEYFERLMRMVIPRHMDRAQLLFTIEIGEWTDTLYLRQERDTYEGLLDW
ncbi:Bifunctional cytochrome P450/NADPH--P450 reductase [Paramyrothecium foliicola]|nr:Bifunctional cytochrome P450/NADPH--P450 reductase [Paramyrothecium foliicola]